MKERKVLTMLTECVSLVLANFLCGPAKRAKRVDKSCPSTVRAHFATSVWVYVSIHISSLYSQVPGHN